MRLRGAIDWASKRPLKVVAALAVFIAVLIVAVSPVFEECVKGNYNANSDQPFYEGAWVFIKSLWWCGGIFSKENGEAITALATVVMAVFTGTLWWSSTEQGKIAQRSIDLAREEFIAAHRPKIIVRGFELQNPEFGAGERIEGWFTAQNIGETPAYIWEINTALIITNPRRLRGDVPLAHRTQYDITLDAGEPSEMFLFESLIAGAGMPMSIITEEQWLVCLGQVRYRDDNGIERETGFCRRWVGGTNTWVKIDGTDYEYSF